MFVKLSFRNICRSSRDYSIFITTLTFSISMIFAYNSLIYNENIAQIGVQMDFMMKLIQAISLILVFMLSWLISYIIKFMFEKRGKEFAIYLTMGMNKAQLVHLFFWEQMILGLLATILGILIGQFIYFTFCQIIYHVLEVSAHPPFVFHRAAFTGM